MYPWKKNFFLEKNCQSYQSGLGENRKYSITLSKKMKIKKSFPLCVRGWKDFFHCIMEHKKLIFHCFRKSLFNIVIFFFNHFFAFFGNFENHHCKNQFGIKILNFFLNFSCFFAFKNTPWNKKKPFFWRKKSFFPFYEWYNVLKLQQNCDI